MHDAKAALSMLEELRVKDELSADDPSCERYVRQDYDSNREGNLEAEIIAELGGIYSPYTDEWFVKATETDIEHIVAASEAHRSGMCLEARADERRSFVVPDDDAIGEVGGGKGAATVTRVRWVDGD